MTDIEQIFLLIPLNLLAGMLLVSYIKDDKPIGLDFMLAILHFAICGGCLVVVLLQHFW